MASTYVQLPVLYVAWCEPDSRIFRVVGRLVVIPKPDTDAIVYEFAYTHGTTIASDAGFTGLPGYETKSGFREVVTGDSPPNFFTPKSGSMETLATLDKLARGEIAACDESFEVFAAPHEQGPNAFGETCYLVNFFVHGVRYLDDDQVQASERLAHGDSLVAVHRPVREDPEAMELRTVEGIQVGYIPRYLAPDTLDSQRSNDRPQIRVLENRGPHSRPNGRLLCQLRACWRSGFRPFDRPTFQPVGNATKLYGHNAMIG
jgi:hypothetical protein